LPHQTEILRSAFVVAKYRSSPIRVDPACLVEDSKFVGVVHRATPNELCDQRGLSCMAASRDDDGPPSPPNHTRMYEEHLTRAVRHCAVDVLTEPLKCALFGLVSATVYPV